MLVNLTDIFTSDNKSITEMVILEKESVEIGTDSYPIVTKELVKLTMCNIGYGKAMIKVDSSFVVMLNCDRCLKSVEYPFHLCFENKVNSPDVKDALEEQDDNVSFMDGYHLNVDDLIYSEMILNWPTKILCREECKGICKVCGKDLNTGECGCDTFVPSPGLAGIKEIFNANKEV